MNMASRTFSVWKSSFVFLILRLSSSTSGLFSGGGEIGRERAAAAAGVSFFSLGCVTAEGKVSFPISALACMVGNTGDFSDSLLGSELSLCFTSDGVDVFSIDCLTGSCATVPTVFSCSCLDGSAADTVAVPLPPRTPPPAICWFFGSFGVDGKDSKSRDAAALMQSILNKRLSEQRDALFKTVHSKVVSSTSLTFRLQATNCGFVRHSKIEESMLTWSYFWVFRSVCLGRHSLCSTGTIFGTCQTFSQCLSSSVLLNLRIFLRWWRTGCLTWCGRHLEDFRNTFILWRIGFRVSLRICWQQNVLSVITSRSWLRPSNKIYLRFSDSWWICRCIKT